MGLLITFLFNNLKKIIMFYYNPNYQYDYPQQHTNNNVFVTNRINYNVPQQPYVHQQYYPVQPTYPAQPAYIPQLSQNQELAYTNLLSQITQVNTKILDDGNQDESDIFQNILINKNKSLDILNSKIVIEEEYIIIDNLSIYYSF